jgi:hypothetical protein
MSTLSLPACVTVYCGVCITGSFITSDTSEVVKNRLRASGMVVTDVWGQSVPLQGSGDLTRADRTDNG